MEKIIEMLKDLADTGEAKIEVSFRLLKEEKEQRLKRPYDLQGRLNGYREIAEFMGTSVNFAMKMIRNGNMKVYHIGKKIFAYEDEIMESLSGIENKSKTIKKVFENKGYEIHKFDKAIPSA